LKEIRELNKTDYLFFFSSILIFVAASIYGVYIEMPYISAIPVLLIFAAITLNNFSYLFYFLVASLPISIDVFFGSLSLSTPSEALMLTLTAIIVLLIINKRLKLNEYLNNAILILIFLQLLLFTFNIFVSLAPVLSLKYLLAKLWFYTALIIIPLVVLRSEKDFKKTFWYFFVPLMLTVFYTIFNHALTGFGFEDVNSSARPFYVNHVIYACTLGMSLPFVVGAIGWYKENKLVRLILILSVIILLFAIITSYTRTTWLSIIAALAAIVVFNTKYLKLSIFVALIGVATFCYYLVDNNTYMKYAPNYQKTVFNQEDFGKHMEATVEMSDISGMERIYRWVAAVNLIKHNFWFGTGNNTFYPTYKSYANPAFVTYVSDNPEKSSTHNYFLMVFSEQGVFGFIIFSMIYLWSIIKTYSIYRRSNDKFIKTLMTSCFAVLVIFLVHLALGDMVEVDKNGGIFFVIISMIIMFDVKTKKSLIANS
jgi:O-antigen ligase